MHGGWGWGNLCMVTALHCTALHCTIRFIRIWHHSRTWCVIRNFLVIAKLFINVRLFTSMTSLLSQKVTQPTKYRFLPKTFTLLSIFVIVLVFPWSWLEKIKAKFIKQTTSIETQLNWFFTVDCATLCAKTEATIYEVNWQIGHR